MNLTNWIYAQDVSEPARVKPLPNEECMCREIFCPVPPFSLLSHWLAGVAYCVGQQKRRGSEGGNALV